MIDISIFLSILETDEERATVAKIFDSYQNAMYWTAYDVLHNREDAEDAVMKALENICYHVHDFDTLSPKDTKRKVKVIVQNAAIDIYRKKSKENVVSMEEYWAADLEGIEPPDALIQENVFELTDLEILQRYIVDLDEKYKVVLLRKYVDGMSNQEIAKALHISESTVATHLQRARQKMKKEISPNCNSKLQ